MRIFQLHRDEDVSGVSGGHRRYHRTRTSDTPCQPTDPTCTDVGVVAEGIEWWDGTVTLKWFGDDASEVSWAKGIDQVQRIHGHDGRTRIVIIDHFDWRPHDLEPADAKD